MKNGIIKIWVCQNCQREYLERQVMCTKCDGFDFEVKYGGMITDAEELSKLVEAYRDDAIKVEAKKFIDKKAKKPESGEGETGKAGAEVVDNSDKNKRTRM